MATASAKILTRLAGGGFLALQDPVLGIAVGDWKAPLKLSRVL